MKFSTEAIVAATVAVVFGALSLGAIAREQGEPATSTPNQYVATSTAHLGRGGAGENDVLEFY